MKTLAIIFLAISFSVCAQRSINESIPYNSGQKIEMKFDYPELVKISTWDKNEISIKGTVTINFGEHDDAFELETSNSGNVVRIDNHIKDMKHLPQVVTIIEDGKKMMFRTKEDYKKYRNENGSSSDIISWGIDMEIMLEITVPKGAETFVESVYGMVEVKGFNGPLTVMARYGGVDAALNEKMVGELSAETNYGQIYSNLDVKFTNDALSERDFYTYVSAKPGTGPRYDFESKYGNVYLRKAN